MITRIYRSTDYLAPVLTYNLSSSLINVLNACLVDGFASYTATGITRSGSTVTVTTPDVHNYKKYTKISISGANESAYNGEWTITSSSSTSFTFDIGTATPTTPATGTITIKQLGAGWSRPYTDVNYAVYRQASGPMHYLQVRDDQGPTYYFAGIRGYESMSGFNTGSNPFPTVAQYANGSSVYKGTADRSWVLWATQETFYLSVNVSGTESASAMSVFGSFNSYVPGDSFNTILQAGTNALTTTPSTTTNTFATTNTSISTYSTSTFISRAYTGAAGAITAGKHSDYVKSGTTTLSNGFITYPNPTDGGVYLSPVFIHESGGIVRGKLPGMWAHCHAVGSFATGDTFVGTGDLAGRVFEYTKMYSNGGAFIELSDTW